jgi:asparagine synthase (glutamine-hydrolysing)
MCGFAAIVGTGDAPPDPVVLRNMTDAIAHRGPDDAGTFIEHAVGLGFRRLSILDLAPSGHQPMLSADGRHAIVFNGEIFNYLELRRELAALGHTFRSTGDTEVLLTAWQQWGKECLPRLNGMWAFLILDRHTRTVFGSRDRFGVKPLFVRRLADRTVLASEIKAIRDSGLAPVKVNWRAVSRFLLESRLDDTEESFYDGIQSIPPGSAFEIDSRGQMRTWRYWSLVNDLCPPAADVKAQFGELFEDAVRLRMRSDVPVGVLLSGGMDSTSIICGMARAKAGNGGDPSPLRAFCYMAREYDETPFIDATLRQTSAELHRLEVTPKQLWETVPELLRFHDEPAHSPTAILGYRLMALARSHDVKVVLNGQGADEVLGGYPSYFQDYWTALLRAGQWVKAGQQIRGYTATHNRPLMAYAIKALRAVFKGGLRRSAFYRRLGAQRRLQALRGDAWYAGAVRDAAVADVPDYDPASLSQVLKQSVESAPLPLYLRVEDRNSMAHSVEARLPFLDYRLVSLAFRLEDDWKLKGPWNKRVLRESMQGRIPDNVRMRPEKFGFPAPVDGWFRNEWYASMRERLAAHSEALSAVCNVSVVTADLERHRKGELNVGGRLFDVAQLAVWLDQCRQARVCVT